MTGAMMRRAAVRARVTWRALRLPLIVAALMAACASPSSRTLDPLAAQLATLQSPNGLFGPPEAALEQTPSAYNSAYGLLALEEVGAAPHLVLQPAAAARFHDDAVSRDALWGRWYLSAIDRSIVRAEPV